MAPTVVYVKLGGSLITDKRLAETPRLDVIRQLAAEVRAAQTEQPDLQIVLGHGSGSFGHVYGRRYGTRAGVTDAAGWYGFAAVADAAARLNRMVVAALLEAGVAAWAIQPSVALRGADGQVTAGPDATVALALERGLLPVVFGDVMLDSVRGGTIVSTEEIFAWLAAASPPARIVLAGEVAGVYTADPLMNPAAVRLAEVTPASLAALRSGLGGSHGVDVTGGMAAKVEQALDWVARWPGLEVILCSGLEPGTLHAALCAPDQVSGTRIHG
jgi:isopentenyl phosphate kinase